MVCLSFEAKIYTMEKKNFIKELYSKDFCKYYLDNLILK